jgi:hypothetical protein
MVPIGLRARDSVAGSGARRHPARTQGGVDVPALPALGSAGLALVAINPGQAGPDAWQTDALKTSLLAHFGAVVKRALGRYPTKRLGG